MQKVYLCSMNKRFTILVLAILQLFTARAQFSGQVQVDGAAGYGAIVRLNPGNFFTLVDDEGQFMIDAYLDGTYYAEITYLGCKTIYDTLVFKPLVTINKNYQLQRLSLEVEEIVVIDEHAKLESTQAHEHFNGEFIEENLQGTFAQSIDNLPGIAAINVGVGIAKPVIRGLSANRIIVNQQGVKQESQQWGNDHGLELDQFDVERVEIIKGPGSLQYGSDGLGGVINIMPGIILPENSLAGSITGVYKSNNAHWTGTGKLAFNLNNFFFSGRYTAQSFGDYRVPADQFEYNGYVLPIFNNRLKNTGGRESNYSFSAGTLSAWGLTRVHFSRYKLDAGLFSGAVGIPRAYSLQDDGNPRDIDVPKQAVEHYLLSVNQYIIVGEGHLDMTFGYQKNLRAEYSNPEFHSIPSSQIDPGNTLALSLKLQTYTFNAHYEHHFKNDVVGVIGGNLQWQDNQRGGFEFLLPNFKTFRSGIFALVEREIRSDLKVNGGVRLDYGHNSSVYNRQWVWNSNEEIIDSLVVPNLSTPFFNWSGAVGVAYEYNPERFYLKFNLGKSFRLPYPSETVSNGIHHGTFRHEMGSVDLKTEHGYQLDASAEWTGLVFDATLSAYVNYFDNFIYLGPTFPAQFSPLPESGQIFQYRQDDALYGGFELNWQYRPTKQLEINQVIDFVQNYNFRTSLALPFTPQPSARTELKYNFKSRPWLEEGFMALNYQYTMAAKGNWRIDRSERATPAYHLLSFSAGAKFKFKKQLVQVNLQVQNILNSSYLNHLSRYRLINVPEQGRNLVLSLKIPFSFNFKHGQ